MPPRQLFLMAKWLTGIVLFTAVVILLHGTSRPITSINAKGSQNQQLSVQTNKYQPESFNELLFPRDDSTCGPKKPCSNHACCGPEGFCGFGPSYCGKGCTSNCDAHAECGEFAQQPNDTCPLNICCSEFGFCGTSEDFCTGKCQSNCVLAPKPPQEFSRLSILENRVIGYYESWSARKECHKVAPTNLPLDALTHVNFAFAYIDPTSYEIVTMDSSTPSSLFQDTVDIKIIKPDIEVWLSIGGWTFSDNDTITQPIFGNIASTASRRKRFAENLVAFLRDHGFDGVDIDWEYPGAPDRGGRPEDTDNFVKLIQAIRKAFDKSGSRLGLTFTAPSSYWYLRWFDLASLVAHVDWINLMTYDLHGIWDSDNSIGSQVQAHTNLTEIKSAVELFWRAKIPPSKLVLGFGFYGRSFTLSNPSCTEPGCPFSGALDPGPCTDEGGILGFYEIEEILKQAKGQGKSGGIDIIHDKASAVKYFVFDHDQWVSYDDKDTFKQKVEWANDIGFGGAMIWASDLDDDTYTAHSALLGRDVRPTPELPLQEEIVVAPQAVITQLSSFNGQNCFAYQDDCVDLDDNSAVQAACGDGYTPIGWDDAKCGKKNCHCGKPICCPINEAPKGCIWRGQKTGKGTGTDCNAQCDKGEINVQAILSSWGGGYLNDGDTNKCGRGAKAFCCPVPSVNLTLGGCQWSACRADCPDGKHSVLEKLDDCNIGQQKFCCNSPVPGYPPVLSDCYWNNGEGGLDCANAVCNPKELEVDRAVFGGSKNGGCSWGRQKAACCILNRAPPPPLFCHRERRPAFPAEIEVFERPNNVRLDTNIMLSNGRLLTIITANYPAIRDLFTAPNSSQVSRQLFRLISAYCTGSGLLVQQLPSIFTNLVGLHTEHPLDKQIGELFVEAMASGRLRNKLSLLGPISHILFERWHEVIPALGTKPAIGGSNGPRPGTINDRFFFAFGGDGYLRPFLATDAILNGAKGKLMELASPRAIKKITQLARAAVASDTTAAAEELLGEIKIGPTLFEYFNNDHFAERLNMVLEEVYTQLEHVEEVLGISNISQWWFNFIEDYLAQIEEHAQWWFGEAIAAAILPYQEAADRGRNLATRQQVEAVLQAWDQLPKLTFPPRNWWTADKRRV
ncbi:hypothetical protein WHR41_02173 [Cladosporium halotolerans]|uniref:chitinase n=1 Tax=Cladosporium halotolerans TaxID=1052096 RepID=A0AB34KX69_9PEZI